MRGSVRAWGRTGAHRAGLALRAFAGLVLVAPAFCVAIGSPPVRASPSGDPSGSSAPAKPSSPPAESSDIVTRAIERRPPARPLSEAGHVDERSLSADELERLARESRERWSKSSHGPMLLRILPERMRPSQLPDAGSRGARLVSLYCVQCHNLPDPAMHDARSWPEVVRRMVPRMEGRGNLGPLMADLMLPPGSGGRALAAPTPAEEADIVRYLQRHAQRGFDPAADPELAQAMQRGPGRMFADACSQCHVLPDPTQHTAEEWPKVVLRMRENLEWMTRAVGGRADPREPQLSVPEIVGFLQRYARR